MFSLPSTHTHTHIGHRDLIPNPIPTLTADTGSGNRFHLCGHTCGVLLRDWSAKKINKKRPPSCLKLLDAVCPPPPPALALALRLWGLSEASHSRACALIS